MEKCKKNYKKYSSAVDTLLFFLYYIEHQHAAVAQLVEQQTENLRVVGSIPTGGKKTSEIFRSLFFLYVYEIFRIF